jgi:hypothetical protein
MNEKAKKNKSSIIGYLFLGWIGIFVLTPILFIVKFRIENFIIFSIFAFPFLVCLFFIPLFLLYDRAKFPFRLPDINFSFNKAKVLNLLLGIMFIPWGFAYYMDEYDNKYGFRVPGETGVLIIFIGFTIVVYQLMGTIKSKNNKNS